MLWTLRNVKLLKSLSCELLLYNLWTSQAKFYIVIFAWPLGNQYRTLAVFDMWLLTQILIPHVTKSSQAIKVWSRSRSSNFSKHFFLFSCKILLEFHTLLVQIFVRLAIWPVKQSLDQSAKSFFKFYIQFCANSIAHWTKFKFQIRCRGPLTLGRGLGVGRCSATPLYFFLHLLNYINASKWLVYSFLWQ